VPHVLHITLAGGQPLTERQACFTKVANLSISTCMCYLRGSGLLVSKDTPYMPHNFTANPGVFNYIDST